MRLSNLGINLCRVSRYGKHLSRVRVDQVRSLSQIVRRSSLASIDSNWPSWVNDLFSLSRKQWFSTISLKGAKFRLTTLLESRCKEILTQVNRHILFYSRTKSFTQIIKGVIEDCWGPHKGCLGAAFGSQNSGWEPLVESIRHGFCKHHFILPRQPLACSHGVNGTMWRPGDGATCK